MPQRSRRTVIVAKRGPPERRPGAGACRPRRTAGLPLAAGRRRRPAEHERVAIRPARRVARRSISTLSPRLAWNRYPDRQATALRTAIAGFHGVPAEQVFAANGSNEVHPDAAAGVRRAGSHGRRRSSRPTSCTATSPGSPGRPWSPASGVTTSRSTRSHVADVIAGAEPAVTFLCSPNNPTGRDRVTRRASMPCWPTAARAGRRRRGLRRVLVVVGARPGRRRRPARRRAHVLQDVEHGGGPARLRGRRRRGWSTSSTRSSCRTTSTPPSSSPGRSPSRHVAEMDERVEHARRGARAARRRPGRSRRRRGRGVPVAAPTSSSCASTGTTRATVWQAPRRRAACSSATAAAGRGSTGACA